MDSHVQPEGNVRAAAARLAGLFLLSVLRAHGGGRYRYAWTRRGRINGGSCPGVDRSFFGARVTEQFFEGNRTDRCGNVRNGDRARPSADSASACSSVGGTTSEGIIGGQCDTGSAGLK